MAFVQMLGTLVRDKAIGKLIVPIVPDESRTFGMEGMFRQLGIYSAVGQLYKPQDADQLMYYREDKAGQVLQEGHQRGGRDELVDRRGDVLQHEQPADDPVLHLLLDVRVAARRRSRVGRRRHARARLPAGRHGGAHDAERRGPAARGRPQPRPRVDDPELRLLRSDVRVRGRRDHPRRDPADVRGAGGRLLLRHADERELPAPGDARRRGGGHRQGPVPAEGGREGQGAARAVDGQRARSCAK